MKHLLKYTTLCLLAAGSLGFTACSSSDDDDTLTSTAGSIGTISLDRPVIGAYQPFTAQCDVKSGSNLVSEKFIWKQNEVEMLSAASGDSYETQNGRSTYYLRGLSAGSHTLVCRMTALGSDGQEFSAEQQLTVEVVPTDIRNNFWGESKSETQRNLTYYKTLQEEADGSLTVSEKDHYGSLNYATEAGNSLGGTSLGLSPSRTVSFRFSTTGTLEEIVYVCAPSTTQIDRIVRRLLQRALYLESFDGFTATAYDYRVADGQSLTSEEQTLADQWKAGSLENDSEDYTLASAVAGQRLELLLTMENEKTRVEMTVSGTGAEKDAETRMVFSGK